MPARDSVGVDPASAIAIVFSEDMARAKVERLVSVQPPITIGSVNWDGRTLIIHPAEGLRRDTTYVVRVKPGYRDRHNVPGDAIYEFAFATGAVLDTARIEGAVFFKRQPAARAFVRAFRVPRDSAFAAESARPDRETTTSRDGRYSLRNLPSNDARFVVMGFVDSNGNGGFERDTEPFTVLADTVVLVAANPVVSGLEIAIVDPNEPALVRGKVTNETGIDSVVTRVGLYAIADSARAFLLATCDTAGDFTFKQVRPGEYVVRAFADVKPDSVWATYPCPDDSVSGCPEPGVRLPGTLVVKPAATVQVPALVVRRREEP